MGAQPSSGCCPCKGKQSEAPSDPALYGVEVEEGDFKTAKERRKDDEEKKVKPKTNSKGKTQREDDIQSDLDKAGSDLKPSASVEWEPTKTLASLNSMDVELGADQIANMQDIEFADRLKEGASWEVVDSSNGKPCVTIQSQPVSVYELHESSVRSDQMEEKPKRLSETKRKKGCLCCSGGVVRQDSDSDGSKKRGSKSNQKRWKVSKK